MVALPKYPLAPRGGVIAGKLAALSHSIISADSGTPLSPPVASSTTMVCARPSLVESKIRVGPILPTAAVL